MAKGIAVTIGLNFVDPKHYQGWDGELEACEADAEDMAAITKAKGFKTATLLTKAATRAAVVGRITEAAKKLKSGDIFFLSYSGHGGSIPDKDDDEADARDETWCLYDAQLIDDEIGMLWTQFAKGVRIFMLSDSCHSGTVAKAAFFGALKETGALRAVSSSDSRIGDAPVRFRSMPQSAALRTYRANRAFYDNLQESIDPDAKDEITATVLSISGCQDNQESADGTFNGIFTGTLLRVWNNGKFAGSYREFHKLIRRRMPPIQSPYYYVIGGKNPGFESGKPFEI